MVWSVNYIVINHKNVIIILVHTTPRSNHYFGALIWLSNYYDVISFHSLRDNFRDDDEVDAFSEVLKTISNLQYLE